MNPIDKFKAMMRASAQRELDVLTRDESLPRGGQRRPDLASRAVSDVQARPQAPQRSIQDFAPERVAEVVTPSPMDDRGPSQRMMRALERAKASGKYKGSDDTFYNAYREHGGDKLMKNVPTPTPTIGDDLIETTPAKYADLITKSAVSQGVPARLLSSLLQQESGFSPDVISGKRASSAGAQGIAQFMPATAKGLGINPLDPNQAIPAAAQYLKRSFDKFGSWELALAAYNAGGGAVGKYGGIPPFPETQNYVKRIMEMASE